MEPTTFSDAAAEGEEYFQANLPETALIDLPINDHDLLLAHRQSVESGSLTPLLKQELRLKIQSRRLTEGKDELLVEFESRDSSQLTEEDIQRRRRRQEQNRRAAQRFRQRRKLQSNTILQEIDGLVQRNAMLAEKLQVLEAEKRRLQSLLDEHIAVCEHPFNFAEVYLNMP